MDLFQLELIICWLISLLLVVRSIVFQLNDLDRNRIVFANESNIKMTCSASDVVDPLFEIRHDGKNVEDNSNNFTLNRENSSIELTITRVNLTHKGTYECTVNSGAQNTRTGPPFMDSTSFYLNVTNDSSVQCLQSELDLVKTEGANFTLYCYFPWFALSGSVSPYDYTWSVKNFSSPLTSDILSGSVKGGVIANVGPLELSNNGSVYLCAHPMEDRVGRGSCEIGPIIIHPRSSVPSTSSEGSSLFGTSANEQPTSTLNSMIVPSSTQQGASDEVRPPDIGTTHPPGDSLTIIIISSVAVISITAFIAVLFCIIFRSTREETNETHEKTARLDYELTDNPMYGSDTEDGPKPRPRSSVIGPKVCDELIDEASLGSVPAVRHFGRASIQDGLSYDKVNNGNHEINSNLPKREVDKGSHKYDVPPSRGGAAKMAHYDNPTSPRGAEGGNHKFDDPHETTKAMTEETIPYEDVKNPTNRGHSMTERGGKIKSTIDFNQIYSVVKKRHEEEDEVAY